MNLYTIHIMPHGQLGFAQKIAALILGRMKKPRIKSTHVGEGKKRAAKRIAVKREANKAIPDGVPYHRQQRLWKDGAGRLVGHNSYRV